MTSEFRVPAPLQNAIDNLAFLASTNDGEKLFFKERLHINKTDWAARLRRFYYNETLEGQKKIIKDIIDLGLDSLKTYKDNVHYNRLVVGFTKAKDGLSNLRNTYLKEGREIQDLDNYIYVMENQINALKKTENSSEKGTISVKKTNEKNENNKKNENIISEQPTRSTSVLNTSEHYHFDSNQNTNENVDQNTEEEKNHYVIDMSTINAESPMMNKPRSKTKAKTIPIKNRPELEEYMNRSKQQ